MNSGMLWFDNDPKTELPEKITQAATYYKKKYGLTPTTCFVNPKMVEKKKSKQGNIEVRATKTIMPHYLWIGADHDPT